MAGKGGGAWKVAYADFVTAMMAFFMVMWIVAQGKDVKEAVSQYFKDPPLLGMKMSKPGGGETLLPAKDPAPKPPPPAKRTGGGPNKRGRGAGEAAVKPPPDAETQKTGRKPSLFVLHDGNRSNMGTVVSFEEDSAELSGVGQARLAELAPQLTGKPNKIEVRGHATRRPLPPGSPFQDAWQLSYARCQATMKFLEQRGVEPERFRLSQGGPFEPLTLDLATDWHAKNSRVEVYVLGEFVEDSVGTRQQRSERFEKP
jgi:chemotaxis protein MotB